MSKRERALVHSHARLEAPHSIIEIVAPRRPRGRTLQEWRHVRAAIKSAIGKLGTHRLRQSTLSCLLEEALSPDKLRDTLPPNLRGVT